MTDFIAWWADHWPLVPVLVALFLWYNWQIHTLYHLLRRREP